MLEVARSFYSKDRVYCHYALLPTLSYATSQLLHGLETFATGSEHTAKKWKLNVHSLRELFPFVKEICGSILQRQLD